jgi:hypothetical protein
VTPTDLLKLYALGSAYGAVFSLNTIGAERARKHPLAAVLTAAVCGLLWPLLLVVDLSGDRRK